MEPIERSDPVRATVEMQVVYNIAEAATHERVMSNSGSSSDHSSPQSPHTTLSISPPNVSDQGLSVEASHAPATNVIARARPRFLSRAQAMTSLMESTPHAMTLQRLKKSEKGHQRDASTHKKRVRRLSKEICMIVSMYAVFQGVLFLAVAQSTAFTCKDRWGPVGIAGGVTIGTLWRMVHNLRRMRDLNQRAKRFKRCESAVYDKIMLLYSYGSGCPIDGNLEPQMSMVLPCSRALLCPRGVLVLGFLVGFSLLMIASCTSMLCPSHSH